MKRLLLLALTLLVATPASAQRSTTQEALVGYRRDKLRLEMPLLISEPTVLVLVDLGPGTVSFEELASARQMGDSVLAALKPTAKKLGYAMALRATTYRGAVDEGHNARYKASPERGGGLVLFRPGSKPSRLLPYLTPAELPEAVADYHRLIRPTVRL